MKRDGDTVPGWTHPPVITLRHTRRVELHHEPHRRTPGERARDFLLALAVGLFAAAVVIAALTLG